MTNLVQLVKNLRYSYASVLMFRKHSYCLAFLCFPRRRPNFKRRQSAHPFVQLHRAVGWSLLVSEEEPEPEIPDGLWLQGECGAEQRLLSPTPFLYISEHKAQLRGGCRVLTELFAPRSPRATWCPAPSRPPTSACGQTGWSRGSSTGTRPSTTPASRGVTAPAAGTEGGLPPRRSSSTSANLEGLTS